jgi:protocatechuate 3,4-dioxygenase beta subunit
MTITGTVIDHHGHAVAGAQISVGRSPTPMPEAVIVTDADGRFTLAVPSPGHYQLIAYAEGYRVARVGLDIEDDGDTTTTIKLRH